MSSHSIYGFLLSLVIYGLHYISRDLITECYPYLSRGIVIGENVLLSNIMTFAVKFWIGSQRKLPEPNRSTMTAKCSSRSEENKQFFYLWYVPAICLS